MMRLFRSNLANIITISRVLVTLFIFPLATIVDPNKFYLVQILILLIFASDGLDGIVARKISQPSLFGSFLDIFADRCVEFIFLYSFFSQNLVPVWFLIIFYLRILATDYCRYFAYKTGNVETKGIKLPTSLSSIVLSPISRTSYGITKMGLFIYIFTLLYKHPILIHSDSQKTFIAYCFGFTALFSIVRGLPIMSTYLFNSLSSLCPENTKIKRIFKSDILSDNINIQINSASKNIQLIQVYLDVLAILTFGVAFSMHL